MRVLLAVPMTVLALCAAGPASAQPDPPPVLDCAKQYLITAGPAPERPVTVTSDGQVVVNPAPTVHHVADLGGDTVRFVTCLAS